MSIALKDQPALKAAIYKALQYHLDSTDAPLVLDDIWDEIEENGLLELERGESDGDL